MPTTSPSSNDVRRILWSVTTPEDIRFMKRFRANFIGTVDTEHTNYLSMLTLRARRMYPPPKRILNAKKIVRGAYQFDSERNFNVASGRLTPQQADDAYWATVSQFENIINKYDLVVIPSGRHVQQLALRDVAWNQGVNTVFIGYGNLPNKTIFDPVGTDADSLLFHDKDLALRRIMQPPINTEEVISKAIAQKRAEKKIPQRAILGQKQIVDAAFLMDSFLQDLTNRVGDRNLSLRNTFLKKSEGVALDRGKQSSGTKELVPGSYFFPLQVSTDVQVVLNYHGGSIYRAIDEAAALGRKDKKIVYYRHHPAETRLIEVEAYLQSNHADVMRQTTTTVYQALEILDDVITINSTVGLEALCLKKNVTFLGRSLYSQLSREELAVYIDRFLMNMSYFDGEPLSVDMIRAIIERATWSRRID